MCPNMGSFHFPFNCWCILEVTPLVLQLKINLVGHPPLSTVYLLPWGGVFISLITKTYGMKTLGSHYICDRWLSQGLPAHLT